MSTDRDSNPIDSNTHRRRASVLPMLTTSQSASAAAMAAQKPDLHHRRRMSVSTIGLTFNTPQSPVLASANWARRASISSSLADENAIDESGDSALPPQTPLTRRLSSGAQALRSIRNPGSSSPNEGFNFADSFRSRAERASISSASGAPSYPNFPIRRRNTTALASPSADSAGAAIAPAASARSAAAAAPPRATQPQKKPGLTDPIQERILKGDFYMD